MKVWYRQKSFWAGIALVASAVWPGVIAKDLSQVDINPIIAGLAVIFLRQSIETNK